ncbi:hypothetical protein TNCT_567371 [Trichonephila clavata]|uniref:Uncharacterized protein n=1 Tax=Trichonephila clavata TaxID=2740835 RepID=A0A8X6IAL8_TRICU|nr:hypothetical protein TNCT_567371 [Trichonephila clavata]
MDPLGQLMGALAALRWILVLGIGSVRGVYAAVAQIHLSIALPGTKAPVVGPAFRRWLPSNSRQKARSHWNSLLRHCHAALLCQDTAARCPVSSSVRDRSSV